MTGIAILHEEKLACYNWKNQKITQVKFMFLLFKLALGYYGNNHSGYGVNPMVIPVHQ